MELFGYVLILLFDFVYWMVYLRKQSKIKKILTIYFATELCFSMTNLIVCVCSIFPWIICDSVMASAARIYMQILITMGVIWFISWFSSCVHSGYLVIYLVGDFVFACNESMDFPNGGSHEK